MAVSWFEEGLGWVRWKDTQKPLYKKHRAAQSFTNFRLPIFWLHKSMLLHEAATVLMQNLKKESDATGLSITLGLHEFTTTAMMLGAMSIECLFKAHLIGRADAPHPLPEDVLRSITRGSHDLVALLAKTGMRTNRHDRELLAWLSHCHRWLGRYPMPRDYAEYERYALSAKQSADERWTAYLGLRRKFNIRRTMGAKKKQVAATVSVSQL